jgi:Cu/Ag efflux pump CusA
MALAGFTINIMTLLAMSLAVGLLIDDAIVVRENIFRHIELGEKPIIAASKGTQGSYTCRGCNNICCNRRIWPNCISQRELSDSSLKSLV